MGTSGNRCTRQADKHCRAWTLVLAEMLSLPLSYFMQLRAVIQCCVTIILDETMSTGWVDLLRGYYCFTNVVLNLLLQVAGRFSQAYQNDPESCAIVSVAVAE